MANPPLRPPWQGTQTWRGQWDDERLVLYMHHMPALLLLLLLSLWGFPVPVNGGLVDTTRTESGRGTFNPETQGGTREELSRHHNIHRIALCTSQCSDESKARLSVGLVLAARPFSASSRYHSAFSPWFALLPGCGATACRWTRTGRSVDQWGTEGGSSSSGLLDPWHHDTYQRAHQGGRERH